MNPVTGFLDINEIPDEFYGYVIENEKEDIFVLFDGTYFTSQSVCNHFGFEQGTLTTKFGAVNTYYAKVVDCTEITNNLKNCDIYET